MAKKLGRKAREKAVKKFNSEKMVGNILGIYRKIVEER